MAFYKSDRERLASIETTLQELKNALIGDGDTGRIPKLEHRVGRLERAAAWLAGAGALIGVYLKTAFTR